MWMLTATEIIAVDSHHVDGRGHRRPSRLEDASGTGDHWHSENLLLIDVRLHTGHDDAIVPGNRWRRIGRVRVIRIKRCRRSGCWVLAGKSHIVEAILDFGKNVLTYK